MSGGPTSHTYVSQALRLHYVAWGDPDAPPLVLVHGGRDHCRNWDWVAEALRREWRIIAPDLRGHGDSAHAAGGGYCMGSYVYDLAQLVHGQRLGPVTLVAHSLGGAIALRYAGIFPEQVAKIVAIEGLGPSPRMLAERAARPAAQRWRAWIEDGRKHAGRTLRKYESIEHALERMRGENPRLSLEQALHLTVHGVSQNEDGTYSWKFDNAVRSGPPEGMAQSELEQLWANIACPALLVYGRESWASNPAGDGRVRHFRNAEVLSVEGAGHWVHHDQLDVFLAEVRRFLS